jgi:hypothetical protein
MKTTLLGVTNALGRYYAPRENTKENTNKRRQEEQCKQDTIKT